jgi:hypothetical protein
VNWLRKTKVLYSAIYCCLDEKCEKVYHCEAMRCSDLVEIRLKWHDTHNLQSEHAQVIKKKRFVGKERREIAGEIFTLRAANYRAEAVIFNKTNNTLDDFLFKKCDNANVLKKIKQEAKNKSLISKDVYVDAEASKILCDSLCESGGIIHGFIQKISMNPFELLLISDAQVKKKK